MSLRSKLEKTPEETSPPKAIQQDRRRPSYGEQATLTRTRDRNISGVEIPQKTRQELDTDRRIAAQHRQWEDQEREDREKKRKWDEGVRQERVAAENNNRQRENAKAVEDLIDAQILAVLDNASVEESKAVGVLIRTKYFASRDSAVWQIALDEVRQKSRAYKEFSEIPMPEIDEMSDTELAKRLGCDVTLAAALRKGFYIGY
jgi:hypothetical protein